MSAINPVTSPTAVENYQQAAPRAQVRATPQEQTAQQTDSVTLSAKAKVGDSDGDGH